MIKNYITLVIILGSCENYLSIMTMGKILLFNIYVKKN